MPTVRRPDAARELMEVVSGAAAWADYTDTWDPAHLPGFSVGHFDFEVHRTANLPHQDFITFGILDSGERYTNDGWLNLSGQTVEVGCFSQVRERVAKMSDVAFRSLADFQGRARVGGPVIDSCFFDESMDVYDEEASYYGLMMAFVVNIKGV